MVVGLKRPKVVRHSSISISASGQPTGAARCSRSTFEGVPASFTPFHLPRLLFCALEQPRAATFSRPSFLQPTMARPIALALCLLVAAACVTARPQATNQIAPASNCAEPISSGIAGGWSPVRRVPRPVFTAIANAVVESGNSTWVPCDDPTPTLIAACSQVVAGTNYQLVADLTCTDISSSVSVEAEVYVPLPGPNSEPEVTELTILSVDGKPVV
ncbi:hypothetical protein ABPG77_008767 [Micractinium sp. CCAP 211/92]